MQFFLREEREERKYIHLRREEGQKTKKKKSLHISHAHLPPPRNTTKKDGIRFTNQRRRGDKKEDRRPEEDHHGQEGALASLSRGSFSDRIPIFFFVSLAQNGCVFFFSKGRRKNATKKRTKKAQHSHLRVSAHSPPKTALSTPSNARIERRNVPGVHRCAL